MRKTKNNAAVATKHAPSEAPAVAEVEGEGERVVDDDFDGEVPRHRRRGRAAALRPWPSSRPSRRSSSSMAEVEAEGRGRPTPAPAEAEAAERQGDRGGRRRLDARPLFPRDGDPSGDGPRRGARDRHRGREAEIDHWSAIFAYSAQRPSYALDFAREGPADRRRGARAARSWARSASCSRPYKKQHNKLTRVAGEEVPRLVRRAREGRSACADSDRLWIAHAEEVVRKLGRGARRGGPRRARSTTTETSEGAGAARPSRTSPATAAYQQVPRQDHRGLGALARREEQVRQGEPAPRRVASPAATTAGGCRSST